MAKRIGEGSLIAGTLAAVGASACCAGPLVLLSLGISGTWIGSLTALEPVRPWFIILALLFFGLSFRAHYRVPLRCEPGQPCADAALLARRRVVFWAVTLPALGLLGFPWIAPLFY